MITVAIPHYHRHEEDSKYLKQCLESIKNQTIYNDLEILMCDDKSPRPDMMDEVIRQTNIKIMVIKHSVNKGVGSTRNTLIRCAKGDYIYFLDSDDMFYKTDALEKLQEAIKGYDVVLSDFYEENFNTSAKRVNILHVNDRVCVHGKLYSLKFLKDNNIYFPDGVRAHEDVNFNIRVMYSDDTKINYLNEATMLWRYRNSSITRSNNHAYSYTTHIPYLIQTLDAIKKTKNLHQPLAVLTCLLYHSYMSAQACKFNGFEKEADEIQDYIKKFIKLNKSLINIIPYNVVTECFVMQHNSGIQKLGVVLFRDDVYTWFKKIGWNIEKNKVFELKIDKINEKHI